jgi:DNA-binding response OmpR family regulator
VRYVRKKVDEPFPLKLIHTVRGVGYCIRGAEVKFEASLE